MENRLAPKTSSVKWRGGREFARPLGTRPGSRTPSDSGDAGRGSVGWSAPESAPAAIVQPWPDLSPLVPGARWRKTGRPRKATQNARPVHPGKAAVRPRPRPLGVRIPPARRGYFRKSEIKDGWRSGPERLGRRSGGGVAPGKKRKPRKKNFKREILGPSRPPCRAFQSPPQRGWPAPQLPGLGRGRAPSPRSAPEGREQQIVLPRGSSKGAPLLQPPRKAPKG